MSKIFNALALTIFLIINSTNSIAQFFPTYCPAITSTVYGPEAFTNKYYVNCAVTYTIANSGNRNFTLNHNIIPGTLKVDYGGLNAFKDDVKLTENYLGSPFNPSYLDSILGSVNLTSSSSFSILTNTFSVPPNINSMCFGGGFVGYDIGNTFSASSGVFTETFNLSYETLDNPFTTPPCVTLNYSSLTNCSGVSCNTCSSIPCKRDTTLIKEEFCPPYFFEASIITRAGTYYHNYTNVGGCDSIVKLVLIDDIGCAVDTSDRCWSEIACGHTHSLGIKTDGSLWAWGSNGNGELGLGAVGAVNVPVEVISDKAWVAIEAGSGFSLGIQANGTLWAWGLNTSGQLGDGTFVSQNIPVQVGTDNDWKSLAKFTGSFTSHVMAIKTNNTLWAWGNNYWGQLGLGNNININVPTQVGTSTFWKSAAIGQFGSLALNQFGQALACGANFSGQLGAGIWDGLGTGSNILLPCSTNTTINKIAYGSSTSYFISFASNILASGYNVNSNYGNDNNISYPYPIIGAGGVTNWNEIDGSIGNVIAIKNVTPLSAGTSGTQGTLWTWGTNIRGMIGNGNGTFTDQRTPFQVGRGNNWTKISGGGEHVGAINADGELWLSGRNIEGQIGDGTNFDKSVFTKVSCLASNNPFNINLNEFTAQAINETEAILNWKINKKENDIVFEIERSLDGIKFEKIGNVKGIAESQFNFIDKTASLKNYYRIKIIHPNQSAFYSKTEIVSFRLNNDITIFPNPVSDVLNFKNLSNANGLFNISIKNTVGQEVIKLKLDGMTSIQRIDVTHLQTGTYFIIIQNNTINKHLTFNKN
jgi:alpha-tubulin suppressor-like RCC1 family protein